MWGLDPHGNMLFTVHNVSAGLTEKLHNISPDILAGYSGLYSVSSLKDPYLLRIVSS